MCFQILHYVDYVDDPDVKEKFEVGRGVGGVDPTQEDLLHIARIGARMWMANQIVKKALEVATAVGRIQEVKSPADIPNMLENSVAFMDVRVRRFLEGMGGRPWYREVTWVSPHIALENKYVHLQLKDFSYVAQVSFNEIRDDQEPMGEHILLRRECRIKFGLASDNAIVYQLPEGWLDVEMKKFGIHR